MDTARILYSPYSFLQQNTQLSQSVWHDLHLTKSLEIRPPSKKEPPFKTSCWDCKDIINDFGCSFVGQEYVCKIANATRPNITFPTWKSTGCIDVSTQQYVTLLFIRWGTLNYAESCRVGAPLDSNGGLPIYSISQEICTRFCCALLCCGYVIVHNEFTWSIYPYSSGLLCWHWGNR